MTEITILDVELVDIDTFELYPGADIFEKDFGQYAELRSKFVFRNQKLKEKAVKKLQDLGLKFQQFYRLEFESDEELKSYPAVIVSFGSEPDLLNKNKCLNLEKHSKFKIKKDFNTNSLVINEEVRKFFESKLNSTIFLPIESNRNDLYWILNLKSLLNPYIVVNGDRVTSSSNNEFPGYYVLGSDGKTLLRKNSIEEIREHKFVSANKFEFNNEEFNSVTPIFFMTGQLAFELRNFLKDSFQIIIPIIE